MPVDVTLTIPTEEETRDFIYEALTFLLTDKRVLEQDQLLIEDVHYLMHDLENEGWELIPFTDLVIDEEDLLAMCATQARVVWCVAAVEEEVTPVLKELLPAPAAI